MEDSVSAIGVRSSGISPSVDSTYRKVTFRLVPLMFTCWMLNYLDRVNVSFAQLQLRQDLGLTPAAYGLGVSLFSIGVVLMDVPSTLLMRRIGARLTLARIMTLMGTISIFMAFMSTPWHWYLTRTLLGAAEGGLWPSIILYFSYWYPTHRRARITSRFLLAIAVAGIVGGPLSGFILQNFAGVGGLRAWQWLFLIEGSLTVSIGIFAFFYLTDRPEQAHWLSDGEKDIVIDEMVRDGGEVSSSAQTGLLSALRQPRIYVIAAGWAAVPLCGAILNYWTPLIIKQSGIVSPLQIGILSALPYLVGAVAMLCIARSSDLKLERRWHFMLPTIVAAIGAVTLSQLTHNWLIATLCLSLIAIGFFAAAAIIWTIPPTYLKGDAAAGGMAVISSMGMIAGFVAPILIGWIENMTGSFSAGILLVAVLVLASGITVFLGVPPSASAGSGHA